MHTRHNKPIPRFWTIATPLAFVFAVLTLVWLFPAANHYKQFVLVHPASGYRSSDVSLGSRQILLGRLNAATEELRSKLVRSLGLAPPSALEKVELLVPARSRAVLDADLPASGRDAYVPARMRYPDGSFRNVRVRYRGDSFHHWGFAAKSWRVRTRRTDRIDGYRYMDLVLPRWRAAASYYVPLRMAAMMGLLASKPEFVELHVNGHRHGGVHMKLRRHDEAFLRRHKRMPGDIYVGDLVKSDQFAREQKHLERGDLPWQWEKAAHNNDFGRQSSKPLEELMLRLNSARDRESHLRLTEMLDLDAWARLSAWMQLVMATHMIHAHNWKLYYDPGKLAFEPIVADGNGLPDTILEQTKGVPGLDLSVTTPLLFQLNRDHRFLRLKAQHLAAFFTSGRDREILAELDQLKTKLAPSLIASRQLDWIGTTDGNPVRYVSASEWTQRLGSYRRILATWFEEQRKTLLLQNPNLRVAIAAPDRLRVEITGHAPVAKLRFGINRAADTDLRAFLVEPDKSAVDHTDLTPHLNVFDRTAELTLPLLAHRRVETNERGQQVMRALPTTYDIKFDGAVVAEGLPIEAFDIFGNRTALQPEAELAASSSLSEDFIVLSPIHAPTVWSGRVEISGNTTIAGDLFVRAGTTVLMGPDASVFVRGRLMLEGTAETPVSFRRGEPAYPWGVIAVLGPSGSGSRLEHCSISGGSGYATALSLLSGMVSFRSVSDLRIDHCRFAGNTGFDDLVHLVYSDATITNSTFEDATADALDLDISRAVLENITVRNSGNDAVDLMTSEVSITGSRLAAAGDKGISVGENSRIAVADTNLAANAIGIEVKDGSTAFLLRTRLQGNAVHISSYRKNPSYTGDSVVVLDHSEISGGGIEHKLEGGARVIYADGGGDSGQVFTAPGIAPLPAAADGKLAQAVINSAEALLKRAGRASQPTAVPSQ